MWKEKVLAILHLTISSLLLGVICDVSELNLSTGEGFRTQRQDDSSSEDNKGAMRFSLINGLVDTLPIEQKDSSRSYEPEKQSNNIDNYYAGGGYVYEKPAIPFEPVPSPKTPLETEPPFESQQHPLEPTYQPEIPLQPETPFQPTIPVQPEFPLEPQIPLQPEVPVHPEVPLPTVEHTEEFGGYQYPRPENPMTYPPPPVPPKTTEPTFPEASARSISVE